MGLDLKTGGTVVAEAGVGEPALGGGAKGPLLGFRWWILFLIFVGSTLNYLDRAVMGILATPLQQQYGFGDIEYGYISSAFAMSYAAGQLFAGGWLDRVGTRVGYAWALFAWSVAAMGHALARGPWGFGVARSLLGIAESPNFPAAAKIVAEWFPRKERAFAYGFVNAGTNMGATLAPAMVPVLAAWFGWQAAFVALGALGLVWMAVWLVVYRKPAEHPMVSAAELAHINSDAPEPTTKVPWVRLFGYRQAWAFAAGKFLTDSMWWFYITWLPKFLNKQYGLNVLAIGLPLVTIYLMSDVGSISGGFVSSRMIKRGYTVNAARKTAMFLCALAVLPIMFAERGLGLWGTVLILGLATAGHQGFSTNLYTLVSDMFPRRTVASVAGFGGMFGYFGASLFAVAVGYMVETQKNYTLPFVIAGLAYLVAFAVIHLLAPRLTPAVVDEVAPGGFPVVEKTV